MLRVRIIKTNTPLLSIPALLGKIDSESDYVRYLSITELKHINKQRKETNKNCPSNGE